MNSDIKFVAVGRALNRDVVASLTAGKNDSSEQYHTAVSLRICAHDLYAICANTLFTRLGP